jgi:hypothetical protein
VYFLCATIFFLAAPIAGFNFEAFMHQDNRGVFRQIVEARMKARQMDEALFAERFNLRFQTVYTLGLRVSIASATLLLALLYRRQRRPFGAHAVFGLHYVGFLYLAAIAIGALSRALTLRPGGTLLLAYVLIGPYLVIALHRVYAQPIGRTLAKALVLAGVGFIVDGTVNLAAFGVDDLAGLDRGSGLGVRVVIVVDCRPIQSEPWTTTRKNFWRGRGSCGSNRPKRGSRSKPRELHSSGSCTSPPRCWATRRTWFDGSPTHPAVTLHSRLHHAKRSKLPAIAQATDDRPHALPYGYGQS